MGSPSLSPSSFPTSLPISSLSDLPSLNPSSFPTLSPTSSPSNFRSNNPSSFPTLLPTSSFCKDKEQPFTHNNKSFNCKKLMKKKRKQRKNTCSKFEKICMYCPKSCGV